MHSSGARRQSSAVRLFVGSVHVPLVLFVLLTLCACAGSDRLSIRHEHTLVPGGAYHPGITRALVFPMNATVERPAGLEVADRKLMELIVGYLSAHGIESQILPDSEFRRAMDISARRARKKMLSGEAGLASDELGFEQVFPELMAQVETDAQIVVMPNVLMRTAPYSGSTTLKRDGVRRRERGTAGGRMSGQLGAGSLYTMIFDTSGERLFSGFGGLDLIYELNIREKKYDIRADLFQDQENLEEGVCISFHPYFGDDVDC